MTYSFDYDRKKSQDSELSYPDNLKSSRLQEDVGDDFKKKKDEYSAAKTQNTILVEALFTDHNFITILKEALNPEKNKLKIRNWIFSFSIVGFFIYYAFVNLSFWSGFLGLFPFFFIYLVYSVFFRKILEEKYAKSKLDNLKEFFEDQSNFNSFLDSLINNKHVGSFLYDDYKINPLNSDWDKQLKAVLYRSPSPEVQKLLRSMNGDLTEEVLHWNLKHLLHTYYASKNDKDLLFFLNQVVPILRQKLIAEQINVSISSKKELFNLITDKIGKN